MDLVTTKLTDRKGKRDLLGFTSGEEYQIRRGAMSNFKGLRVSAQSTYCQKFRNCKKQDSQTYVEFSREKEGLFDHWCTAKEVDNEYNKLRQLMLIEEFKKYLHSDVKMYLDEQKADGLHQAAVLTDDYSLIHKQPFL